MKRITFLLTIALFSLTSFATIPQSEKETVNHDVNEKLYMVVDLSQGSSAISYPVRYTLTPPSVTDNTCKTTELWLRFIPAGHFKMGSNESELGRLGRFETRRLVILTKPYYMGVFEVTQKQWALVMGNNPASDKGDTRPVESVSYDDIRGTKEGALWPTSSRVDMDSFIGKLRERTKHPFDLPTEAQWEYACRAGTVTAFSNGKDLTDEYNCKNMMEIGRYPNNRNDGKGKGDTHTCVGSYQPNPWGLYDMHGNVLEWNLDYRGFWSSLSAFDPVGAEKEELSFRALRGGSWHDIPVRCRSASRFGFFSSGKGSFYGLRISLPLSSKTKEQE